MPSFRSLFISGFLIRALLEGRLQIYQISHHVCLTYKEL
jgi:hypothetical protein